MSPYLLQFPKRFFDILFSILVLPIALPIIFISAIIIYITDGGPIFIAQERVGMQSLPFKMFKIRTLQNQFKYTPGKQHDTSDILWIGVFLRKFRIDELPQIVNIFKGEMSWVGPRPEFPYFFEHYLKLNDSYSKRQSCRPGITGLAQINDPNATPENTLEKLPFDLKYVQDATIWMDIHIMIKSFFAIWN
jgi:lipopolysaccharide/colanic/teichoic acid biosynthesis glycosyltransferase